MDSRQDRKRRKGARRRPGNPGARLRRNGMGHLFHRLALGQHLPRRVLDRGAGLGDVVIVVLPAAALGAELPVCGDGAQDEARVDFGQLLVPEPPGLHLARGIGLDEDVRMARKGLQHVPALLRFEVQGNVILVAAFLEVGKARVLHHDSVGGVRPDQIAPRGLDANRLGAQLGQERGTVAARHAAGAQVDHDEVIEGLGLLEIPGRVVQGADVIRPGGPFRSLLICHGSHLLMIMPSFPSQPGGGLRPC